MANFTYNVIYKGKDKTKGASSSVKRGIGGISKAVAGLTAILAGGGFVLAGKQALDAADGIQKLRDRTGASTEFLSQMRHAVELTGGEFGTFSKGMTQLNRNVTAANEGMSTQVRAFERIGISVDQLKDKSPEQVFALVADNLAAVEDPAVRSASAMDIFGRAGSELIPLLTQGSEGINKMRSEADLLGKTLSDDQVNAAAAANDAFARLRAGIEGLVQTAAIQFAPTLEGIAHFLTRELPRAIKVAQAAFFILRKTMLEIVSAVSDKLAAFYDILGNLPGDLGRTYRSAADQVRGFTTIIDDQAEFVQSQIDDIADSAGEMAFKMGQIADVAEVKTAPALEKTATAVAKLEGEVTKTTTAATKLEISFDNALPDPSEFARPKEELAAIADELNRILQTSDDIRSIGGFFGIDIPQGVADEIAALVPEGAQNALGQLSQGAQTGAQIGAQLVGTGAEEGAAIGGAIGTAIGAYFGSPQIGAAVGGFLGGLIDGKDEPESEIRAAGTFGVSSTDDLVNTRLGQFYVRSGVDGFDRLLQTQVTGQLSNFLNSVAQGLSDEQLARVQLPTQVNLDQQSVTSGEFLEPFFDSVLEVFDPAIQSFVNQFGNLDDRIKALDSVSAVFELLDQNPVETFAEQLAQAEESTIQTLSRMGDEILILGENATRSIQDMDALGVSLQEYNQFVIQSLAQIESARRSSTDLIQNTRDSLQFQTLDGNGQFEFVTRRANQLFDEISGLGTATEVQNQVARITSLVEQAFGLADPEQQQALLRRFDPFLQDVDSVSQAQYDQIEQQLADRAEADRQALAESVGAAVQTSNESSGIVAAGVAIGDAAGVIGVAGRAMLQAAQTPVQVAFVPQAASEVGG